MRVLIIEDEARLLRNLAKALREEEYAVDTAADGQEGLYKAQNCDYDAIVLDIMLPRLDGWQVLERLRKTKKTPVVFLTARDTLADRVRGLDGGGDDYLVKPFDLDELSARIRALMRRRAGRASPLIEHGELTLNPATHEVTLRGSPVKLSRREFALLHALLEQPGVPLSRAQLEERIYGWDEEVESNTVEVYIHSTRRKLGAEWIRNVRGVGYMVPELP